MIFFSLYFCLVFQNTGFRVRPTDRGWTLGSATGLGMYILISGPTCKMEMTIRASFFLAQYLADVTHGNYFCYWPPGELSDHGFLYCWTAIYIFACMLTSTSTFFSGGGLVAKSCPTLVIPWTVACQAPLSMGFSRQEYWSGLPFPSSGDLPNPGIKPKSPTIRRILYWLSFTESLLTREAPLSFLVAANSSYRDMVLYGQSRDVFWAPIWA